MCVYVYVYDFGLVESISQPHMDLSDLIQIKIIQKLLEIKLKKQNHVTM